MSFEWVSQSRRGVPVLRECDVLIVGGTVAGVAAALSAAEANARVVLVTDRPYLGEDLCATLRMWRPSIGPELGRLGRRLFAGRRITTPMRVKKTLERELLEKRVEVILCSYLTEVIEDDVSNIAGGVIANRSGRQAVLAKRIVDATTYAWTARLAGAAFVTEARQPERAASWFVLCGTRVPCDSDFYATPFSVTRGGKRYRYLQHRFPAVSPPVSFVNLTEAEEEARNRAFQPGQVRSAGRFWCAPPDSIVAEKTTTAARLAAHALRPENCRTLFVAGPCAAVTGVDREQMMEVGWAERLGGLAGQTAACEAVRAVPPGAIQVQCASSRERSGWDVRECLGYFRTGEVPHSPVPSPATDLPVWDTVDVVVAGGGTSGACAAIGAGRRGMSVLVLEYQAGLGGTGTLGLIGKPYGRRGPGEGFDREVPFPDDEGGIESKMHWFRREIRKTGGRTWCGVLVCGTVVEGNRVRGVVVATPEGRGVVVANVVIDATGNADVASAAGAETRFGNVERDLALQGAGLPPRPIGECYVNTDYLLVDETDIVDVTRAYLGARRAMSSRPYDACSLIQSRERCRIVGDHTLRYLDQVVGRTYTDSILFSANDYDSHGYPSNIYFALIPHDQDSVKANHPAPACACWTPYRCLLPRGLDGMLVTGLGISMERDAAAFVRMQHDMHKLGYAAGVAAALAVQARTSPRGIDVQTLQKHLVEIGNLPAKVLRQTDALPFNDDALAKAIQDIPLQNTGSRVVSSKALAIVFLHPERSVPLLRSVFAGVCLPEVRLVYARVLGCLGDPTGVPVLIDSIERAQTWDEKILQGRMAEYAHLPTPQDATILALGYAGDRRAIGPILRKLETLDACITLSHHRAVAVALEKLGDPEAALPLARLLKKSGMSGHCMTTIEPLYDKERRRRRREGALREITVARALVRCGDCAEVGRRILEAYRRDVRGLFARHAAKILAQW